MAEASVGIKLNAAEYRFLHNELEMLADELREQQKGLRPGKDKTQLRQREAQLRFMLEKI